MDILKANDSSIWRWPVAIKKKLLLENIIKKDNAKPNSQKHLLQFTKIASIQIKFTMKIVSQIFKAGTIDAKSNKNAYF